MSHYTPFVEQGRQVQGQRKVWGSRFWGVTLCTQLKVKRRFEEHVASIFRVEK
jgi:hypothetical protein